MPVVPLTRLSPSVRTALPPWELPSLQFRSVGDWKVLWQGLDPRPGQSGLRASPSNLTASPQIRSKQPILLRNIQKAQGGWSGSEQHHHREAELGQSLDLLAKEALDCKRLRGCGLCGAVPTGRLGG